MAIDMSPEEFRRLGYRAIDLLAASLRGARRRPVPHAGPRQRRRGLIDEPLPTSADADAMLDEAAATILPYPMGNGSPRFFGWVNSPAARSP